MRRELDRAADLGGALARAAQHAPAEVDADDLGARRVERDVAAGADADVEDAAARVAQQPRAQAALPRPFVGGIEQVVDRRDALVGPHAALGAVARQPYEDAIADDRRVHPALRQVEAGDRHGRRFVKSMAPFKPRSVIVR